MEKPKKIINKMSTTQLSALGFLFAIVIGTCLLKLPFAAVNGTSWIDALFTATTSICVTGLSTVTMATHWTLFGKIIILFLCQLGGFGVITVTIFILVVIGKKISMRERIRIRESYNLDNTRGMVILLKRIIKGTFFVEGIGAICFSMQFIPQFRFIKGVGYSIFHSVSAFCNAGIDILGDSSFRLYVSNPIINITTMTLIVVAGIGFPVWWDIIDIGKEYIHAKKKTIRIIRKLKLHSKVAITTTIILIAVGAIITFICEYSNPNTIGNLSFGQKLMASLFQSVTTRTAGFESISQAELKNGTALCSLILMFIGGSPAGTAGGIKTTTVAIVVLTTIASLRGNKDTEAFQRKISPTILRTGLSIILCSFAVLLTSTMLLFIIEDFDFLDTLYETISAIATVGLTRGITAKLSVAGKLVVIVTMYIGRVGPITMAMAMLEKRRNKKNVRELPERTIILG